MSLMLITPEWLESLRDRAGQPRFVAHRRTLAEQVASFRDALPPHPVRQAGYYHDFFCPEHAVQLRFDPRQPHRHVCPIDGAVFSGEPFDSAWRWSLNDLLSDAALKLALSATLDENGDDAGRALAVVRGYADRYQSMEPPLVPHPNHPGVVTFSGLDESVWIIRLAWAHALARAIAAGQDGELRDAAVRDGLLRPAADHLLQVRWPEIHNVTTWNNAALVTLALALGDDALLDEIMHGALGVDAQLAEGLLPDGSWWEGSLSYHYYTLAALVWTGRALRASGQVFAGDDALKRMFAAPLALAFPDLTLPAVNDCWEQIGLLGEVGHGIPDAAGFYEVAYGWYGDHAFAWVLGQNEAVRPRRPIEALLDGATSVPAAPEPTIDRRPTAAAGVAVLRSRGPRERSTQLLLKAGPDGGGHGHPDQLCLQLFAGGARLATDLGTAGYGISLNDTWYRQTASHGTVLLDGQSQPPAAARLDRYEPDGDVAVAEGSVEWDDGPYAGVEMRRTLILRDDYCLDVFQVRCPTPRQIDWLLPCRGALVDAPAGEPAEGALTGSCGYEHFAGVRRLADAGAVRLRWQIDSASLDLSLPPEAGERFVATAPGNPAADRLSVLVRRRVAEKALFVAVLAPAEIRQVRWEIAAPGMVEVETSAGVERWAIDDDGRVASLTP
jgi:hypothetical protein